MQPESDDHGQKCPKLLELDIQAKAEYVSYYNECGDAALLAGEREEAAWSKLSGYAARLALVGQLAHDPKADRGTCKVMAAACNLARWSGNEAARIYATFAETPEQREQRKLVEFAQSRGGRVRIREVTQSFRPLKGKPEEAKTALNKLVAAGHGEWIETRGELGPATHEFQLLPLSTSTGFSISPSIPPKPVDVDAPNIQKNEAPPGPQEKLRL